MCDYKQEVETLHTAHCSWPLHLASYIMRDARTMDWLANESILHCTNQTVLDTLQLNRLELTLQAQGSESKSEGRCVYVFLLASTPASTCRDKARTVGS